MTWLHGFDRNTLLRAGAGTGKTESLATLHLHLLAGRVDRTVWPRALPPERIVALTFTERAAREMRARIEHSVSLLASTPLPDLEPAALALWLHERGHDAATCARLAVLRAAADEPLPSPAHWHRVAAKLGRAPIGTFHATAARMLRRAWQLRGETPRRVLDPSERGALLRASVIAAVKCAARNDRALVADLAAATGGLDEDRERGLFNAIAALVDKLAGEGVSVEEVRAAPALDAPAIDPRAVSVDVAALAVRAALVPALAADGVPAVLDRLASALASVATPLDALAARSVLDALDRHRLPARNRTRRLDPEALAVRAQLDALGAHCTALVSHALAVGARGLVGAAQHEHARQLASLRAIDLTALPCTLRDLLRDDPAARADAKSRLDALLVDEFQDTHRVECDLVHLLREDAAGERVLARGERLDTHELAPAGLLLVGDPKQSIYAFRGTDAGVFLETERAVAAAGGRVLQLTTSHRSLPGVLAGINPLSRALLGGGLVAHAESIYEPARDALVAAATDDGAVRVEWLVTRGDDAAAVRVHEADAIAERVSRLLGAPLPSETPFRRATADDIAVLVPTWKHTALVQRALRERGVAAVVLGGPGFWSQRAVDDLVTVLRHVAHPADRLALASVLRGPLATLTDAALVLLFADLPREVPLATALRARAARLAPDESAALTRALDALGALVSHQDALGPADVLRGVLDAFSIGAVFAGGPDGTQAAADADKLVGIAESMQHDGMSVAEFVAYVDGMREAGEHEPVADVGSSASGAVRVLSIHAAKGLEWPVVVLAQASRRRRSYGERCVLSSDRTLRVLPADLATPESFRDVRRDAHGADEDDQRRLLHVAMTRARDLLVVCGPAHDGDGEWRTLGPALASLSHDTVRRIDDPAVAPALGVRARRNAPVTHVAHAAAPLPAADAPADALAPAPVIASTPIASRVSDPLADAVAHLLADLAGTDTPVASAALALIEACPPAALARAVAHVTALDATAFGRALRRPGAVLASRLAYAARVSDGEGPACDHVDTIDLLLDGEPFGCDGVLVAMVARADDRDAPARLARAVGVLGEQAGAGSGTTGEGGAAWRVRGMSVVLDGDETRVRLGARSRVQ